MMENTVYRACISKMLSEVAEVTIMLCKKTVKLLSKNDARGKRQLEVQCAKDGSLAVSR